MTVYFTGIPGIAKPINELFIIMGCLHTFDCTVQCDIFDNFFSLQYKNNSYFGLPADVQCKIIKQIGEL